MLVLAQVSSTVHIRPRERPGGSEPAEPAADDHDTALAGGAVWRPVDIGCWPDVPLPLIVLNACRPISNCT